MDEECVHVWAPFQMEPFSDTITNHGVSWIKKGSRCTKVFCQKCKAIDEIKEKEPDTGI